MYLEDYQIRNRVILYGCGGHARSIISVIRERGGEGDILLVDDNVKCREIILGCKTQQQYIPQDNDDYIIAIGDNSRRARKYQMLSDSCQGRCIAVISVSAYIGLEVKVGEGSFVAPNAYIGPQAIVGNNTIVNTGSIIEHETQIGDHTHIAPRTTVCGRTRIGNFVFCGAGSTIIDNIEICDNVVIGAGAVVNRDIVEPGIYVGVPARRVKQK